LITDFLLNPNIIFLLLVFGLLAILIEIIDLALGIIGVFGVIALALGVAGLLNLEVNSAGLLFIIGAIVCFGLEHRTRKRIIFTLIGLGFFILGTLIMFNTTSAEHVSIPLVVTASTGMAAIFYWVSFTFSHTGQPIEVGMDTLVGRTGEARTDIDPQGTVQVAGELWTAVCDKGFLAAGEGIIVVRTEGIRLVVRRNSAQES
jgi:membrane-bound serine protease (ClpP class)